MNLSHFDLWSTAHFHCREHMNTGHLIFLYICLEYVFIFCLLLKSNTTLQITAPNSVHRRQILQDFVAIWQVPIDVLGMELP